MHRLKLLLHTLIFALSVLAVVGCRNQPPDLDSNCYVELASTIASNNVIQLQVLADLEAGEIARAKKTLMTVLLVDAATLPGMVKNAGNPRELEMAADRVASNLLDILEEELRLNPERAHLITVESGLAGIKQLVKQEADQKQVSEMMIRLYGTDDIDVPFYLK